MSNLEWGITLAYVVIVVGIAAVIVYQAEKFNR